MEPIKDQIDLARVKEACIERFATYARLLQDEGYFDKVHEQLCDWTQGHIEKLEREVEARGICNGRLLYVMPRGSLKSTIGTKHLTSWLTLRRYYKFGDDSFRTLLSGNTYTNAKKKLKGIRSTFDNVDLFRAMFPEVLPRKGKDGNKWSDEGAEINRKCAFDEATFECAGMNTKLTGRHYNCLVEDDTTAPDVDEMKEDLTRPSMDTIEKAIGFHRASMPLFVPKGFRLSIIISTRWAYHDLVSYVQEQENYNYFDMPAERNGKPVFNCFYDLDTLAIIKTRVGEYMYNMLYLNNPLDDSMRVFQERHFIRIKDKDVPKTGYFTVAVDPAISEKDEACESAITVNQHVVNEASERHEYWWEDISGHFLPFALAEKILNVADKYDTLETPVKGLIIEDVAYQAALKYILLNLMEQRKLQGKKSYSIIPFRSRSNKLVRIEGMQPSFEQGRIHFVKGSLSDQTESQLLQFPNGKLMDTIDSWSMHRKVWRRERHELPRQEIETLFNTFEQAYKEITTRSRQKRQDEGQGLGSGIIFAGEGLTGYSNGKGRNHVYA